MKFIHKLILAFCVGFLTVMGLSVVLPSPAKAIDYEIIRHHSPDDGYDDPIRFSCWHSSGSPQSWVMVEEGTGQFCTRVGWIWVRTNEEIHCWTPDRGWFKFLDAAGTHRLWSDTNVKHGCVVQRD